MATELLAIGSDADESGDVTVPSGEELTVAIKDAYPPTVDGNAIIDVQLKDDDNNYFNVDVLDRGRPALILQPGTWRFARRAGGACGVFSA